MCQSHNPEGHLGNLKTRYLRGTTRQDNSNSPLGHGVAAALTKFCYKHCVRMVGKNNLALDSMRSQYRFKNFGALRSRENFRSARRGPKKCFG